MSERETHHPTSLDTSFQEEGGGELQPAQHNLLKQARERKGVHLATLAVTLKVPVARLEALEAGRYDELPDPTFARALAQSVCKVLKVDPAPILLSLPSAHVADLGPSTTAISTPMPINPTGGSIGSNESMVRIPTAVLVAALLMVVAAILWVWLPERTVSSVVEPIPLPQSLSSDETPGAHSDVANPSELNTAEASNVSPHSNTSQMVSGVLHMVANDTAWIEVAESTGQVVVQRHLEAQEAVAFSSGFPLSIVIGRADVVSVQIRGEAFDLSPWTRGNVARFEVR